MNSNNKTNHPYVHTCLTGDDGTRCTCTEVFLKLGLEEKAQLEFNLTDGNNFHLVRVPEKGKWRSGSAPHERTARQSSLMGSRPSSLSVHLGNTATQSLSM